MVGALEGNSPVLLSRDCEVWVCSQGVGGRVVVYPMFHVFKFEISVVPKLRAFRTEVVVMPKLLAFRTEVCVEL